MFHYNWALDTFLTRIASMMWTYTNLYLLKNFLLLKRSINFVQLASVFCFLRECWKFKVFNPSANKKVTKKNFFSDIANIDAAENFDRYYYAMHIASLALQLRKNTSLSVHLFPYWDRVIFCWEDYQWSLAEYDFNHGSCHMYTMF